MKKFEVFGLELLHQLPDEELLVVDGNGRRVGLVFKERLPFVLVELLPLPNPVNVRALELGRTLILRKVDRVARLLEEPGAVRLPITTRDAPEESEVCEAVVRDHGANSLGKDGGGATKASDSVVGVTLNARNELGLALDSLDGCDDSCKKEK